jgi:hypothetical protein
MYPAMPVAPPNPGPSCELLLDPIDPSFVLGAGPNYLGNYQNGPDWRMLAMSSLLLFGDGLDKRPMRAIGPSHHNVTFGIRALPLLWGPQRGFLFLKAVNINQPPAPPPPKP